MSDNLEMKAEQYYKVLCDLEDERNHASKAIATKVKEIGKERFIREYPLSLLGVISYRTFWEICHDSGIVSRPFYSDESQSTAFEKELHDMLWCLMYQESNNRYHVGDIEEMFVRYGFRNKSRSIS